MKSHEQSTLRARLQILCLIGGLLSFGISIGQPRDLVASRAVNERRSIEMIASQLAWALLLNDEAVAVGRFSDIPSSNSLQNERITVTFTPVQVFKGPLAEGLAVRVEMNSDMVVFPETEQSRYVVRHQMYDEWRAEREELERQVATLDQDHQAGRIASEDYEPSMASLQERVEQSLATFMELFSTGRRVSRGSFYDWGGVMRPDEEYLVILNVSTDDFSTYVLRDTGGTVLWGEWADDVRAELEARR